MYNHFLQEWQTVAYPCGKCWNCIHSFRESWRIRLYETLIAQKSTKIGGFIYDTLTVSNDNLPLFCEYDKETGEQSLDYEGLRSCGRCLEILRHYNYRVPYLSKYTVSRWLESGRNRYNYYYRDEISAGRRERLRIKYFGALEYGPLWSRPHVHICLTGLNRADYVRFFAQPWRESMGFTKTKFIDLRHLGSDADEHVSRISAYISKYLLKGSYESDLVKYGFVEKAWRVVSHGIGEEYLENPFNHRFDWLLNDTKYWMSNRIPIDEGKPSSELYKNSLQYARKFLNLSTVECESLSVYIKGSYKYALPRYYRDKLCCTHRKGIAGCAIKVARAENVCNDYLERVAQHRAKCAYFAGWSTERVRSLLEQDPRELNIALYQYTSFQRVENKRLAAWHKLQTSNTSKRIRSKEHTQDLDLLL